MKKWLFVAILFSWSLVPLSATAQTATPKSPAIFEFINTERVFTCRFDVISGIQTDTRDERVCYIDIATTDLGYIVATKECPVLSSPGYIMELTGQAKVEEIWLADNGKWLLASRSVSFIDVTAKGMDLLTYTVWADTYYSYEVNSDMAGTATILFSGNDKTFGLTTIDVRSSREGRVANRSYIMPRCGIELG